MHVKTGKGWGELGTFNRKNGNNASFMIINKTLRWLKNKSYIGCYMFITR